MGKTYFKEAVCVLLASITFSIANAQVGIGTTTPEASAELDITSANRGFLMPRVALNATADTGTITGAEATGLMVYNTATVSDVTPGFYYWNGTQWVRFDTNAWSTTGNAGTNATNNFLGTTDAQDLVFRTNNTEVLRVTRPDGSNDPKIIAGNAANHGDINDPLYTFSNDDDTGIWSDGGDEFSLGAGGREFITIDETTQDILILNDRSQDIDLRVESNGEENMFFVDANNDRIGVLTNTPQTDFHIGGNGVLRLEDLNAANDADNNGIDLAPLAVNANGDVVIGGQNFLSDINIDLDETTFLEPAEILTSNIGQQSFGDLLPGGAITFTLTQTTMVEINFSIPCYIRDPATGGPVTDGLVRWFGVLIFVDGGFENWFTENYTNGTATFTGGGAGAVDTYTSGPFMLNGSTYVTLGPGAHAIDIIGTTAGAFRVNGAGTGIVDFVDTEVEFGGNGGGATLKIIYHN
jgi:hypothetical protein